MTNTKKTKSKINIDLQNATSSQPLPTRSQFKQWVTAALSHLGKSGTVVIRIVDSNESAALNRQYRHKTGPTNVLSFPIDLPPGIESPLLGDIVICASLVTEESAKTGKTIESHWAHLVIHGVLHLLEYDHIKEEDAEVMEALEIKILKQLKFPDPYNID